MGLILENNIILVHLGDVYYQYINDNIRQLLRFSNKNIYVAVSNKHIKELDEFK